MVLIFNSEKEALCVEHEFWQWLETLDKIEKVWEAINWDQRGLTNKVKIIQLQMAKLLQYAVMPLCF